MYDLFEQDKQERQERTKKLYNDMIFKNQYSNILNELEQLEVLSDHELNTITTNFCNTIAV